MPDIRGSYDFYGRPYKQLIIVLVSANGSLDAAFVDNEGKQIAITGTYDQASNQLKFNDAQFPGEILFTTFFTGKAFVFGGQILALAGTWTEQSLSFRKGKLETGGIKFQEGDWIANNWQAVIG